MELYPPTTEEAVLRRQAEQPWLPYHRHLEAAVESHALADYVDLDAEVELRRGRLESDSHRVRVAVDGAKGQSSVDLATDRTFVGFVMTDPDPCPPVFDRLDRLKIGDIYVRESHRGNGLGRRLVERARERACDVGCSELLLDVDVDNERALGVYDALGFEEYRHALTLGVEQL